MNQNVSFRSRFSFKDINETDIQKDISNLNSKKAWTFENIPTKVLKELSELCNTVLKNIWNYETLGTKYFSDNLKLADITPACKKKDPTLVENYRPASVLPCVSKNFKRIILSQFSSFTDELLYPYLCG